MRRRSRSSDDAAVAAARRDGGFSLVELVVTVSIMGLAMIPILIAALSLIKNSSYNRNATKVETVLANAGDRVNRAGEGCDYDQYVKAAVQAQKWDVSQVAAEYFYYTPGVTATTPGTWNPGVCPTSGYSPELVQLVDITVTSPDGNVRRSMQVVKSRI